jgi:hypothetical protein
MESIMGVKQTERTSAKTQRKLPVKKSKKATRTPKVKKSTDNNVNNIDAAIQSMTNRMAASKAEMDATIKSMIERGEKDSAKVDKIIEEMRQNQKETNQALQQTIEELHKTTQDLSEKLNKTTQDLSEELNKTTQELSEKLNKTTQELSESIHDIDGNVGGLNRRLGKIVELVVLPGLMEKMNKEYSHQFDNVAPNKKFTADGQLYAEMDLFLENGDSVMAVEAKTRLTEGMVNVFVQKLESLRQHEVKAGLVGKTIYAAVASIIFDDNARKAALEKGIYLVSIDQNNEKIKIEPLTRPAGKW